MRRTILALVVAGAVIHVGSAYAQETAGAGRVEFCAFPGGGVFFSEGTTTSQEPSFANYALGGSFTYNVNRWVGVEGEVGGGVGVSQSLTLSGTTLTSQKTPHMLAYNGNVIVHPGGNDRAFVPYVTGGLGGLTMFSNNNVLALGVVNNQTYFTGNVGAGLKWFAKSKWGLRGDYRFIMIRNDVNAPLFFAQQDNRYGHRIYGGLLFTY